MPVGRAPDRIEREFVSSESPTMPRAGAGGSPCQGIWHHRSGTRPEVAFMATHYEVDFSEHYLADWLAARGFGFLGWNTRYRGMGAYFALAPALVDIGVGVRWLREVAGARSVVLLGNSGGASLMAAYQAEALGPPTGPTTLGAADLFISLNAHPGRPDVLTAWMDPSVTDEADPLSRDPALDMFDPTNAPPYSPEFVATYRAAQEARNHRITAWAQAEITRLASAGARDRLFCVHRTWADLRFRDPSIDPSQRPAGCYAGDPRAANAGPLGLASTSTLRTWLEMWSLAESRCRASPSLSRIRQPALVIQSLSDQGCWPSDATAILRDLGSGDKTLELVAGDHYLQTPDSARSTVADLIAAWVSART
ncbi:MAG: alpha/beta hydrolase [Acidimicrobiales bacterium]